jgi:4-oxalocrotonate tautomerase
MKVNAGHGLVLNPESKYVSDKILLYTGEHHMPVVIIKMKKGSTIEQKRRIVKEFTNTLVSTLNIDPDLVTIMIDEHDLENIGKAGKLRCD